MAKKRKASKTEAVCGKKAIEKGNEISTTKVQKLSNKGDEILNYFATHTVSARACAIALGMQRDCFSSRLSKWVRSGKIAIARDGRDECTHRRVHFYTADMQYVALLEKARGRQLSFFDIDGFDEKGGMS